MYAIPPLVSAVPAAVLVRRIYLEDGTLPRNVLIAGVLIPVALVCDLTFLIINIHHPY